MYVNKTNHPLMGYDEPQLGTIEEPELIEADGEGKDILIGFMAESQEVPNLFYAIDDFTGEDIELKTIDYLNSKEIDILNAMFMETDDWTEEQLKFILDNLTWKEKRWNGC